MSTPSYIATNQDELFEKSSKEIQDLILGGELNTTTAILGKIYKIPISSYIALENIISFLLIGALQPENTVLAIQDLLGLSEEDAYKLASDLDKSILEKARVKILGKAPTDMVELTFKEGRSEDDLRKEILDTTKRESALIKERASVPVGENTSVPIQTPVAPVSAPEAPSEKKVVAAPGSRSQLMEQLQVLDNIPDDEEIAARLTKIQEQIASIDTKRDDRALDSKVPLQNFLLGDKATEAKEPELQSATYSKAPTKYNVDPYREQVDQ